MEINGDMYSVAYDPATTTVTFKGNVRLLGVSDYDPIKQLLDDVVALAPETLTLDLLQLKFLNSLGTYLLLGFVIKMRDQTDSRVIMRGMEVSSWQKRSFQDLERLMPRLQVEWV